MQSFLCMSIVPCCSTSPAAPTTVAAFTVRVASLHNNHTERYSPSIQALLPLDCFSVEHAVLPVKQSASGVHDVHMGTMAGGEATVCPTVATARPSSALCAFTYAMQLCCANVNDYRRQAISRQPNKHLPHLASIQTVLQCITSGA